ncbi:FAD-binding domain-containing protein [Acephala macrosclerotiorum]|nr:FAD-binding domain-containing protein [Acephala macrosclerotiorum]
MASKFQIVSRKGVVLEESALSHFKTSVKGEVVIKGEAAEEVYLAAIDRFNKAGVDEAGIIVYCESEQDVAACLKFVQQWDLEVVIACGRHSYYKASTTKGGLVIDLAKMKKVSIDREGMKITAQGGCQAADLEIPLQEQGLSVVMGAANDTGGSGFLTGQYGLVIDNLLAVRVVIADGSVLEASEEKNADLFWGIRGGGSNFGVVTEFTFKIHNQGPVFFGPLIFTPDKIRPFLELAEPMRQAAEASGGKLAIFFAFTKAPGMPSVHPLSVIFYDGPEEEARKFTAPLFELGPAMTMVEMKKYVEVTTPSLLVMGPPTHQHYSTSNSPLSIPMDIPLLEEMIADLDVFFNKYGDKVGPSKIAIELRSYAKSASVDPSATALRARAPTMMMVLEGQHDGSTPEAEIRAEVQKIIGRARVKGRRFINANIGDGSEKVADIFGDNFERLRQVKRKYDPGMVFNKWYPIPPAEA